MYGAVARDFTEQVCVQYGVNALNQLLVYAEAAGAELETKDPGTQIIQVPDAKGELHEKLFAECTVAELRKAIQRLRRPTSGAPLPPDIAARAQQCGNAWTSYLPKTAGIRVEVRNRKGKAVLSLKDIPLEQMEQLTALLGTSLRPARAA